MKVQPTKDRSVYLVRLNGSVSLESPWYSEAVSEWNSLIDNARHGDVITLWYIKDMDMPIWKDKNATLLAGYRK